ncbi:hypothetical protein FOZ63_031530, partial [Perkinsus olseni]
MDRIVMALWSSLSPSPSDQGPAATITPSSFHHLQLLTVHALLGGALTDAEGHRSNRRGRLCGRIARTEIDLITNGDDDTPIDYPTFHRWLLGVAHSLTPSGQEPADLLDILRCKVTSTDSPAATVLEQPPLLTDPEEVDPLFWREGSFTQACTSELLSIAHEVAVELRRRVTEVENPDRHRPLIGFGEVHRGHTKEKASAVQRSDHHEVDVVSSVTLTSLAKEMGGEVPDFSEDHVEEIDFSNEGVVEPADGCLLGVDEEPLQGAVRSRPVCIMITSRGSPTGSTVERVCRLLSAHDNSTDRLQLVTPKYVLEVALATPTDLRTPLQNWACEELLRGVSLDLKIILQLMLEMICRSTRCQQVGFVMQLPEPMDAQQAEVISRWLQEVGDLSKQPTTNIEEVFRSPVFEEASSVDKAPRPNPLGLLWSSVQQFCIDLVGSGDSSLYVDRESGVVASSWDVDRVKAMMDAIQARIRRAEENPDDEDLQVPVEVSEEVKRVMSGGWEEVPSEGPSGMEDCPDTLEALTREYLVGGAKADVFTCLDLHRRGEWMGEGEEGEEEASSLREVINRLARASSETPLDAEETPGHVGHAYPNEGTVLINGDGHDEWDLAQQIRHLTSPYTGGQPLGLPLPLDGAGGEPKELLRMGYGDEDIGRPSRVWSNFRQHCPVAFRDDGLILPGDVEYAVSWADTVFMCSTRERRREFVRNPRRYAAIDEPSFASATHKVGVAVVGCRLAGKSTLARALAERFEGAIKAIEVGADDSWIEEAAEQLGVSENIQLLEERRVSIEEAQRVRAEREEAGEEEEGPEEGLLEMPDGLRTTPDCHYLLVGPTMKDIEKWRERSGMAIGM